VTKAPGKPSSTARSAGAFSPGKNSQVVDELIGGNLGLIDESSVARIARLHGVAAAGARVTEAACVAGHPRPNPAPRPFPGGHQLGGVIAGSRAGRSGVTLVLAWSSSLTWSSSRDSSAMSLRKMLLA
jgi:hypothetical protein